MGVMGVCVSLPHTGGAHRTDPRPASKLVLVPKRTLPLPSRWLSAAARLRKCSEKCDQDLVFLAHPARRVHQPCLHGGPGVLVSGLAKKALGPAGTSAWESLGWWRSWRGCDLWLTLKLAPGNRRLLSPLLGMCAPPWEPTPNMQERVRWC